MSNEEIERVLALTNKETARDIRTILAYPKETAGHLMSLGYVQIRETATQAEALQRFRENKRAEPLFYLYVVEEKGVLCGRVDLRTLLSAAPSALIAEIMDADVISVFPECDQEQAANIFSRYDLTALLAVSHEPQGKLLGVITADDIIDVIQQEADEDVTRISSSDAEELENKSPAQVAKLRLP